eukprot:CAMPEP_0202807718 /NCGR_PEP_ID=MMETSP1389-20130828/396_1 /ASSEMBLY_ACC=CAM_ASM_000865 /TAXON_ID=302021 /ORGANISM="Rhodomonas sp., Strain CCMP768" /LENGTH=442 /DNA_ID=CAMNT_0049477815 /DNA_START=13 /DNA_END=1342 /DNA_ORIENTATION=-
MSNQSNTSSPPTTSYAQQGQVRTVMQPQVTTKLVPMPVQAPLHIATALPELVHMKYCVCPECEPKKKFTVKPEAPAIQTPQNVPCNKDLCQAADEAVKRMGEAKDKCKEAEDRLRDFQKRLDDSKRKALKAERDAENAIDNYKEITESIEQVGSLLNTVAMPEKQGIEEKKRQARDAQDKAEKAAQEAATAVMVETKEGERFKIDADKAREITVNRTAECTLALCRAAVSCESCAWFDTLNQMYETTFTYKCDKCGWTGDYFDVQKHQAGCSGESSKMYNCELGCGFKGDFDVVAEHEAFYCSRRPRTQPAPVAMMSGPGRMVTQPVPQQSQRIYTSSPNVLLGGGAAPASPLASRASPLASPSPRTTASSSRESRVSGGGRKSGVDRGSQAVALNLSSPVRVTEEGATLSCCWRRIQTVQEGVVVAVFRGFFVLGCRDGSQ